MKIAIFFEKDRLGAFHDRDIEILVFHIQNNQVMGVESLKPCNIHGDYRMQILKSNGISDVYLLEIEEEWRQTLQQNNIRAITDKTLMNNKLLNSLYFSNMKSGG
ncbi:hypothetical protein [Proteiniphilum sp.]|uniref:hypothetical protein n=1 Tax=Proteiniphilum sp. TaxID=1926877 RepID=UPI00332D707A